MNIFKNKLLVIIFSLFIPLSVVMLKPTILYYPYWVKTQIFQINKDVGNDCKLTIGSYGDMFGGLNAFISGFAFLALLGTIGIQIWLHYRQEESKKQEVLETATNKLIYLDSLVKQSFFEIDLFKIYINELEKSSSEKRSVNFWAGDNSIEYSKINYIVNKIDQEVFFTAYYQKYKKKI